MIFGNYNALWLLFLVPILILPAYAWYFWRRAEALRVLASSELLRNINPSSSVTKKVLKATLLTAAFVFIVVALTEPKWNPRPKQIKRRGRDIAVLLDTSRSMLAEDIKPSRLERAKIAVGDLIESLGGDRIAIVTFAGSSSVKCPLTQDYGFVRMVLADIDTTSAGRGGTLIGDAVRKAALEVFDKSTRQYKDIILITDGDDQDSFPVEAARKAAAEGIRIIAIGMGDENTGSRIPITDPNGGMTFLTYQGHEVWSKLDADTLREMVYTTEGGKYLSVEPGTTLDLGQIYDQLIASAQKKELESFAVTEYDEKFQLFLAAALVLLACEMLVSERRAVADKPRHAGRAIPARRDSPEGG